jgi:hypothetical protein
LEPDRKDVALTHYCPLTNQWRCHQSSTSRQQDPSSFLIDLFSECYWKSDVVKCIPEHMSWAPSSKFHNEYRNLGRGGGSKLRRILPHLVFARWIFRW